MFPKLTVFFVSTAAIVSAMPQSVGNSATTNGCNVGVMQCCQSIQAPGNQAVQNQAALLANGGIGSLDGFIGLQCNPISGFIGAGTGSNCNENPVCCTDSRFNGLFVGGCSPINVNV